MFQSVIVRPDGDKWARVRDVAFDRVGDRESRVFFWGA